MDPQWDDSLPIYRQLRDRVVAMILEGALKDGDRIVAARTGSRGGRGENAGSSGTGRQENTR